jgi:hypothetical protein
MFLCLIYTFPNLLLADKHPRNGSIFETFLENDMNLSLDKFHDVQYSTFSDQVRRCPISNLAVI